MAGRLIGGLIALGVSTFVVFFVVRLIPGDPIVALLQQTFDPRVAQTLRRLYGLDRPIFEQYISWISSILQGDFGLSLLNRTPIADLVAERIPRTLFLMLGGLTAALAIAVPVGIVAAIRRRTAADYLAMGGATLFMAMPINFLGIVLIIIFAAQLRLLPSFGYTEPADDIVGFLRGMILPCLALGMVTAAYVARVLRSSLLDVLDQDFVTNARSKGLRERTVVLRHAVRNAMIPTLTVVGLEAGALLGGAVVTEKVFAYPGMGTLIVDAIVGRDYPTIQAGILFFAAAFIVINLVVDILYGLVDPRIRQP